MRRTALGIALAAFLLAPPIPAAPTDALLDPAAYGRWDEPFVLPVQGEDAVLLPTGKVLLFAAGSDAQLWDPATGALEPVPAPEGINCAGLTLLPDGRVLANGGHNDTLWKGSAQALVFNPWTKAWTKLPDMVVGRYYPTTLTMADGRALTLDGNGPDGADTPAPETWDGAAWTLHPGASQPMEFYPRAHVVPGGDIIVASQQAETYRLDAGTMTWTAGEVSARGMRWGSGQVLLPDLRTVLVAGGGSMGLSSEGAHTGAFRDDPTTIAANLVEGRESATASAQRLDATTMAWRDAASMSLPRRDLNLVLLADGTPLAVGGAPGFEPVPGWTEWALAPEAYDASADAWTTLAPSQRHRGYHSTALLLPDGRVLATGGDFETGTGALPVAQRTGELFSPPHLFAGARPVILDAPGGADLGAAMPILTPDADRIAAVHLARLDAATHGVHADQRVVPLAFEREGSGALVAWAPEDAGAAPPGWYMLFLLSDEGVPSVAAMLRLG